MKYLILNIVIISNIIFSQISPGDLTKAHANLEGLSNCTKCHELGEKVLSKKCLDCHTEIKDLINNNRGYHSTSEVKNKECFSCHSEHHGRNFQIVRFDKNNFDHKKTGFELTGKHKNIDCNSCHQSKNIKNNELKKRSGTFLGLDTKCISCHLDVHQGTLSINCNDCHSTETFRPASKFDHNKSRFILTGKHLEINCSSCHKNENRNGKNFIKFTGLNFSQCSACHKDVHEGKFGNDCQKCHSTNGFKLINTSGFNHNQTNFPLVGKHQTVSCSSCHGNNLSSKPKYEKCIDCHSDYHGDDFTVNNKLIDCSSCHNVYGFSPSLFTIEKHNSIFELKGSHLAIPCHSCHYKNEKWHFKNIGNKCIDCHSNIHGKELTIKYLPDNNCSVCHSEDKWTKISFNHNETDFQLLGKHKDVSCNQCHVIENNIKEREFKFVSLNSECVECHKDIHNGQFVENNINDCSRCHSFNSWKPEKFDHNKTNFVLTGAHSVLECSKCHYDIIENEKSYKLFKLKDFKCSDCHS